MLVSVNVVEMAVPCTVAVTCSCRRPCRRSQPLPWQHRDALVVAVTEAAPPNVARAPVAGAWKTTTAPTTGLPPASRTRACSCVANAVEIAADWLLPATAAIDAGSRRVGQSERHGQRADRGGHGVGAGRGVGGQRTCGGDAGGIGVDRTVVPPANDAPAPPTALTVKVTGMPAMIVLPASRTRTPMALANAVLTGRRLRRAARRRCGRRRWRRQHVGQAVGRREDVRRLRR